MGQKSNYLHLETVSGVSDSAFSVAKRARVGENSSIFHNFVVSSLFPHSPSSPSPSTPPYAPNDIYLHRRQIFNAILGWNNNATLGSVLMYVFYWLLIVVTLVYLKWKEGRMSLFGLKSAAAKRRDQYPDSGYEAGQRIEEKKSRNGGGPESPGQEQRRVPVLNVE